MIQQIILESITLYNYVDVAVECEADNMLQIFKSMDNGVTYEAVDLSPNTTTASSAYLTISNLTYTSTIKFHITNNGYELNDVDNYYGFESADSPNYFMHHCDENMNLGDFSQETDRTIPYYQWQIVQPGLNGEDGTVSIKGQYMNGDEILNGYMTIYDTSLETTDIKTDIPTPAKGELVSIECIADDQINISFAQNGVDFTQIAYSLDDEEIAMDINNVTQKSKIQFSVFNINQTTGNPQVYIVRLKQIHQPSQHLMIQLLEYY